MSTRPSCSRCGAALQRLQQSPPGAVTFGGPLPTLYRGVTCTICRRAECTDCKGSTLHAPCSWCGGRVAPAWADQIQGRATNVSGPQLLPRPDDFEDFLQAEVSRARQNGLQPYVFFYSDGCRPSRILQESLGHPLLAAALRGAYLIQVDADRWYREAEAAGFSIYLIPLIYRLDERARPQERIDGGAWGEDTPENMAQTLKEFFRT